MKLYINQNISFHPEISSTSICIHSKTDMKKSYGFGVYFHPSFNYFYTI